VGGGVEGKGVEGIAVVGFLVGELLGGKVAVAVGASVGEAVGAGNAPYTTYIIPPSTRVSEPTTGSANGAPISKSLLPSPLTSPAALTELPL